MLPQVLPALLLAVTALASPVPTTSQDGATAQAAIDVAKIITDSNNKKTVDFANLAQAIITSEEGRKQVILQTTNTFRAKYGAGPLTWNEDLARSAKAYNDQCIGPVHDGSIAGVTGENICFWFWNKAAVAEDVVVSLPKQCWFAEESKYDGKNPGPQPAAGHFTQVVWKKTTQMGCAWKECSPNQWSLNCRYSVIGNTSVLGDAARTRQNYIDNVGKTN